MISDEIRRLHELHQAGALTDAEFEQAKAKVLAGASHSERINLNKDGGSASYKAGASDFDVRMRALRRSRADRWLGGVCGGLNGVMGVETWVWRLLFLLFALITSGFGALVYVLMWIFVPEE
jgi:phage shock protein PspC (stress-responsive transcriptional regulator)